MISSAITVSRLSSAYPCSSVMIRPCLFSIQFKFRRFQGASM